MGLMQFDFFSFPPKEPATQHQYWYIKPIQHRSAPPLGRGLIGTHRLTQNSISDQAVAAGEKEPSSMLDAPIYLADASDTACRWIVDSNERCKPRCCGQETLLQSSYCPEHHRIVYVVKQ